MDHQHARSGTSQAIMMIALMAAMCLAMPLSLAVLGALGVPTVLAFGVAGALLLACVFGHRFLMRH
ncbi:MAG TPA: hypothetical protein VIH05_05935 [Tepidiformaceae bacterium]